MHAIARRASAVLLAALVALLGVWLFMPQGTVPLYDGLCGADAYKYLGTPPPGIRNGGVPGRELRTEDGYDPGTPILMSTDDNDLGPPQAQVAIRPDSLAMAGPGTIHLVLEAVLPPPVPVGSGHLIGNVYAARINDAQGRPIALRPGTLVTVYFMPPKVEPGTSIERFDGTHWTVLDTAPSGSCSNAIQANSDRLGLFASVDPTPTATAPAGTPAWLTPALAFGSALVLLLVVLALVRVRRRV